ncbi:MAG: DUF459 domain-containing protein [Gemmobacter sp.]
MIGDSLAGDYCRGLQRHIGRTAGWRLLCWAHPSSGLTRIDFFDWDAKLRDYLAAETIDVAFVSMGANDAQRIVLTDKVLDFETEAWAEVYGARVAATIAQLGAAGAAVVWVGLPTASSARYARRLDWLNGIYEAQAEAAGIAFVPLWERTSDASGRYVSTLPDATGRDRPARKSDGFHFSMDGETLVACDLLTYLPGVARAADLSRNC